MNEETLICQMIIEPSIIPDVQVAVSKECFSTPFTKQAYDVCIDNQSVLDPKVFCDKMKGHNVVRVQELLSLTPTASNWTFYADKITSAFMDSKRKEICMRYKEEKGDSADLIAKMQTELTDVGFVNTGGSVSTAQQAINSTFKIIDTAFKTRNTRVPKETGIRTLDTLLYGIQNELYVIGARPSVGKTALSLQIMRNISKDHKVAYFSIEMSKEALIMRMIAGKTGIPTNLMRSGYLTTQDLSRIQNEMTNIWENNKILIIDTEREISRIEALCRKLVRCDGVDTIMIDHFSLTRNSKFENRFDCFADNADRFLSLRKELNVPIILLSQVRRDVEGKPPTLADLRETGNLEQNADTVIFIDRERTLAEGKTDIETRLIVAKQREGACGTAECWFVPKWQKFICKPEDSVV